jgi:hypothetical protein
MISPILWGSKFPDYVRALYHCACPVLPPVMPGYQHPQEPQEVETGNNLSIEIGFDIALCLISHVL